MRTPDTAETKRESTLAEGVHANDTAPASAPSGLARAVLQRKLQRRLLQRRAEAQASQAGDEASIHQAAEQGIAGSSTSLPYLDTIQRSFGAHDVSGIQAHTGPAAVAAAASMGAEAYATGNHVAFGGAASLHTAAHEAAHVIQQRAGVSLAGGIGQEGDAHEQHADRVADLVVQGKSADSVLSQMAGGTGSSHAVQRKPIRTWWVGEQLKFQSLLGGAKDTDELSVEKLEALIQFLEGDSKGKGQTKVIADLRSELASKKGPSEGTDTPAIEEAPQKPIIQTPPRRNLVTRTEPKPLAQTEQHAPLTSHQPDKTEQTTVSEETGQKAPEKEKEAEKEKEKAPIKEGTLRVESLPGLNVPANGVPVFKSPPEYIRITFNGAALRVKAGQDFLNTEKSVDYQADGSAIRGANVVLYKPTIGSNSEEEDVRVIGDGHHRFVWASYHGLDVAATEKKIGRLTPQPWSGLYFRGTPSNLKNMGKNK